MNEFRIIWKLKCYSVVKLKIVVLISQLRQTANPNALQVALKSKDLQKNLQNRPIHIHKYSQFPSSPNMTIFQQK